jgi:hypothetical protein
MKSLPQPKFQLLEQVKTYDGSFRRIVQRLWDYDNHKWHYKFYDNMPLYPEELLETLP